MGLDFDKADSMAATQDVTITPNQLEGEVIPPKFVKFQNVNNIQFFFKDNQEGVEVTQIDFLSVIGTPIDTTNMKDFKRVAGRQEGGDGVDLDSYYLWKIDLL